MDLLKYYIKTQNGKAKEVIITEIEVQAFMSDQTKKDEFAKFIHDRMFYRYVNPFLYESGKKIEKEHESKKYDEYSLLFKNGFSIMANACLLIETLEAFYRGRKDTKGSNKLAFFEFFSRDKNFTEFATDDIPTKFYEHIRCGILHQGETTGGWTLTRDANVSLLDKDNQIINATKFISEMKKSLADYKGELQQANWNDKIWDSARDKIRAILKNTKK